MRSTDNFIHFEWTLESFYPIQSLCIAIHCALNTSNCAVLARLRSTCRAVYIRHCLVLYCYSAQCNTNRQTWTAFAALPRELPLTPPPHSHTLKLSPPITTHVINWSIDSSVAACALQTRRIFSACSQSSFGLCLFNADRVSVSQCAVILVSIDSRLTVSRVN